MIMFAQLERNAQARLLIRGSVSKDMRRKTKRSLLENKKRGVRMRCSAGKRSWAFVYVC